MNCPRCQHDLSSLENYDNINQEHNCLGCGIELYLDYDEWCTEDYSDCWDLFEWKIKLNMKEEIELVLQKYVGIPNTQELRNLISSDIKNILEKYK